MNGLLVGALIRALLNERVVDRLFALVGTAVEQKNAKQTTALKAHVDALELRNAARFAHLEEGVARLDARVSHLERRMDL